MVPPTKDHNLCLGDADGEAIGCTERLRGVQQLLQPLRGCGEQRNVISISKRAKLCTYFAWFLRPSQLLTVPYFELPMPISRLQLLMQFRMGSHALPVEQGRLARPAVP